MKKILLVVSLLMGGIPGLVSAETIPYSNNFEIADSDGQSIFSNSAYASWTGSSEVSAVITNGDASPLSVAYIGTPMAGTHSRILKFSDGTITNSVDGTSVDLVGIDTMIQPSLTQDLDTNSTATAAFSNAQFAIAFFN